MRLTYIPVQEIQGNQHAMWNTAIPCNKGYVIHENGSGLVNLRGIVNNQCARFARYSVIFNGNIAVPTGGTAGPIDISLAIGGESIQASIAEVTPTVVDAYFNVTCSAVIDVPRGCCSQLTLKNVTANGESINLKNASMDINRIA